jgi:hypothetical protein
MTRPASNGDGSPTRDDPASAPTEEMTSAQDLQLSREQQYVLEMVGQGKNVFFTGPAGNVARSPIVLLHQLIYI